MFNFLKKLKSNGRQERASLVNVPLYSLYQKNCIFAYIDILGFKNMLHLNEESTSLIRDVHQIVNKNFQPKYNQVFLSDSVLIWSEISELAEDSRFECEKFISDMQNKCDRLFKDGLMSRGIIDFGNLLFVKNGKSSFNNINVYGKKLVNAIDLEKAVSDPCIFLTDELYSLLIDKGKYSKKKLEKKEITLYFKKFTEEYLYQFYQNYFKLIEQDFEKYFSLKIEAMKKNNFKELTHKEETEIYNKVSVEKYITANKFITLFQDPDILKKHKFLVNSHDIKSFVLKSMITSGTSSEFLRKVTEPVIDSIYNYET